MITENTHKIRYFMDIQCKWCGVLFQKSQDKPFTIIDKSIKIKCERCRQNGDYRVHTLTYQMVAENK